MSEENFTTDEHYVPQFYLNYFIPTGETRPWICNRKTGKCFRNLPKTIGFEKHLYETKQKDDEDLMFKKILHLTDGFIYRNFVEGCLCSLEGLFSQELPKLFKKMENLSFGDKLVLTKEELNWLILFVAISYERTPKQLNASCEEFFEGANEEFGALNVFAAKKSLIGNYVKTTSNFNNPKDNQIIDFIKSKKNLLDAFVDGSPIYITIKELQSLRFNIVKSMDGNFITSSDPVNACMAGGNGKKDFFTMPLSPKYRIFFFDNKSLRTGHSRVFIMPEESVHKCNAAYLSCDRDDCQMLIANNEAALERLKKEERFI